MRMKRLMIVFPVADVAFNRGGHRDREVGEPIWLDVGIVGTNNRFSLVWISVVIEFPRRRKPNVMFSFKVPPRAKIMKLFFLENDDLKMIMKSRGLQHWVRRRAMSGGHGDAILELINFFTVFCCSMRLAEPE